VAETNFRLRDRKKNLKSVIGKKAEDILLRKFWKKTMRGTKKAMKKP